MVSLTSPRDGNERPPLNTVSHDIVTTQGGVIPVSEAIEETSETGDNPTIDERKFTQTELDALITKRLAEERSRRDREDEKKAKAMEEQQRIAALQGEERIRAEYEQKLKEIRESEAQAKRSLAISKIETMLSSQGLPSELAPNLLGETDEDSKKNFDAFSKAISALVSSKVSEGLNHGTPPAQGGTPSKQSAIDAELDRRMSMQKK